jgi:hypothetical protein
MDNNSSAGFIYSVHMGLRFAMYRNGGLTYAQLGRFMKGMEGG